MMHLRRVICAVRLLAASLAALVAAGGQAFAQAPTVTSVATNPFSYLGAQTVVIGGTGFFCGGSFSCVTSVTIGGAAATSINVVNDSILTATTPADSAPPSP